MVSWNKKKYPSKGIDASRSQKESRSSVLVNGKILVFIILNTLKYQGKVKEKMEINFVHEIVDEGKHSCTEEGLAPSTTLKRIRFLEKILFGNKRCFREGNCSLDQLIREPANKEVMGPHGKNNYITALKWYFKRSKLVSLPQDELSKLKKFKAENKGLFIEEDVFYRLLSYAPTEQYELAILADI